MHKLQNRRGGTRGFSLVELLMVVLILLILIGITTRVVVYVNTRAGIGKAAGEMERLKNAIVEYHATFGILPPVNPTVLGGRSNTMLWVHSNTWPAVALDFHCYTGLAYYLWSDDIPERSRWDHYIKGMDIHPDYSDSGFIGGWVFYSNAVTACRDPWDNDYRYESYSPFQSFRLWSLGPDRVSGSADDIGTSWSE